MRIERESTFFWGIKFRKKVNEGFEEKKRGLEGLYEKTILKVISPTTIEITHFVNQFNSGESLEEKSEIARKYTLTGEEINKNPTLATVSSGNALNTLFGYGVIYRFVNADTKR